MNTNDVIEAYITDVAVKLPRRQRNDVAFELRALLAEELQARAEATGRDADAAMTIGFLREFGRPEDVAARYRPELTIIDPADGRHFLRAAVIGLAVIWCLGLWQALQQPAGPLHALTVLGQWWGGTVIPSLWWPGVLVVYFGVAAWTRRRWPKTSDWKPRTGDLDLASRTGMVMGLVGIVCGLLVLIEPRWVLDFFWGGRAAPVAYEALTYTDAFRQRQGPVLLVLLLLNIPLFIAVIVSGRWSSNLRRMEDALGLAICAALIWVVLDGPVLVGSSGDQALRLILVLIIAFTLIGFGIRRYRSVRPAPN